jgi:phosphate transport system substrate-binding protein
MSGKACRLMLFTAILGLASCTGQLPKSKVIVQGAGATFPAPLYQKWLTDYSASHPDQKFTYQSVGSGAGIQMFSAGQVEFGASDAAMTDQQIKAVGADNVLMLPLTAGCVALGYNLPEAGDGLKLTREAYAGIFEGKITSWDDSLIAATNPKVQLSKTKIAVLHRLGSSGTTYVLTQHLSAISDSWKKGPGTGFTVQWPVGTGVKASDGMAETIKQTPGAIGFLEYGSAMRGKVSMAALQNRSGGFVQPNMESGQAGLAAGPGRQGLLSYRDVQLGIGTQEVRKRETSGCFEGVLQIRSDGWPKGKRCPWLPSAAEKSRGARFAECERYRVLETHRPD